jgi:hypothetical protein
LAFNEGWERFTPIKRRPIGFGRCEGIGFVLIACDVNFQERTLRN